MKRKMFTFCSTKIRKGKMIVNHHLEIRYANNLKNGDYQCNTLIIFQRKLASTKHITSYKYHLNVKDNVRLSVLSIIVWNKCSPYKTKGRAWSVYQFLLVKKQNSEVHKGKVNLQVPNSNQSYHRYLNYDCSTFGNMIAIHTSKWIAKN